MTIWQRSVAPFGTGSALQQGIQAATAAVQGLAGGSLAQAVTGAAAPYLAEQIHRLTEGNPEANLMAHAVVGAVVAQASGNSALSGAAGAASASAATSVIAKTLYGTDDYSRLNETQKQTISALSTLAGGLAGGLTGDSVASVVSGAQAGKNTSENNDMFSLPKGMTDYGQSASTLGTSLANSGVKAEEINAALSKNAQGDLPAGQNAATGLLTAWGAGAATIVAPVLLPAAATAGNVIGAGAIGGSANVFNQLNSGGPFSATDALIATGVSALTQGKGFLFTEAASITGAYVGASLQGKDAAAPMIGAGLGTLGGTTIGKGVDKLQTIIPQSTIPKITEQ
ncbi:VENN motif pre-toxin domain-containing protein [Pantoea sp. M_9]|uniref:VENN motif pre-toxin domain-containing protein n=1 Tax=Pantoea sp. M_9 TaxID=2608041 RepID=UPI001CC1FAEA|nr:VENN motif pre-toxin domain-containing protein [Pantoea sp. M_9]